MGTASIMLAWSSSKCCELHVYLARNNEPRHGRPAIRGWLALLALAAWLAGPTGALGQGLRDVPPPRPPADVDVPDTGDADDDGQFEVLDARTSLRSGVYVLDARIAYRLSADAREALRSGVPLTIRLDIEFLNRRRFWFDGEDAALRQRYQLAYHALSERYIVTNLNSGDQSSYGSFLLALSSLGSIDRLPLIDAAVLDPDRDYDLRLRAVLDVERFPGPLRLLAFWRRDWSIASDWYRWPLQND